MGEVVRTRRATGAGWGAEERPFPTRKRPLVSDGGRMRDRLEPGGSAAGYPLIVKWPRSVFLNRASFPLAVISRRIAL